MTTKAQEIRDIVGHISTLSKCLSGEYTLQTVVEQYGTEDGKIRASERRAIDDDALTKFIETNAAVRLKMLQQMSAWLDELQATPAVPTATSTEQHNKAAIFVRDTLASSSNHLNDPKPRYCLYCKKRFVPERGESDNRGCALCSKLFACES